MNVNVDYGFYTIPLKYSACTVKVWLYKGELSPTYNFKIL
jgi:ribosomal protein S3